MAPRTFDGKNGILVEAIAPTIAAFMSNGDASVLPQAGYLTADWVKRHYSISNSTLYKWIADSRDGGGNGFPAPVRIGPRAVRWSASSLRAFEAKFMEDGH